MTNNTVTQEQQTIKIKIQRVGHFYYYTRWLGDQVQQENVSISRETADTVIRAQCNGLIPSGVNLDVVKPRHWEWEKEIEE